jgi:RNA polymerase sigma-70 factor (ECF subfamily)
MNAATWQLNLDLCAPDGGGAAGRATLEAALVAAAQRGDSAAFGRLIQRYQGPLLRYLCRLVRRADVGQDLCQETLLRAWRRLGDFDGSRPLAPWLYRIATNLALNFLQRRAWRFVPLLWRRAAEADEQELPIADATDGADELLLRGEAIDAVQRALERLDAAHRAPLLLYYGEELSVRELAEALEVTEAAAKVRLFRARARLKRLLGTEARA